MKRNGETTYLPASINQASKPRAYPERWYYWSFAGCNPLLDICNIMAMKWNLFAENFPQNNTKGIHIDRLIITPVVQ